MRSVPREFLFSNFGQTVLHAPAGQADTTLFVEPSSVERFPHPQGPNQVFAVILTDGRSEPEICWVTDNPDTGELEVLRGQEGTPPGTWATGTSVIHTHTKDSLEWFVTGGQILWKQEFEAKLNALAARMAAAESKNEDQDGEDNYIRVDMEALFEQSGARLTEYQNVVADAFFAQSTRVTTLEAWQGPFTATVTDFMQATATTQFAQAQRITTVETEVGQANAKAQQALTAYSNTQQSYASLEQTVNANFGANSARMNGIDYTMANNYQALAQSINTVSVNLGGLTSRVDVVQEATGGPDGMRGMFAVRLNADGSLAYFDLVAGNSPVGGQYSSLKIGVNQFIIDSPAGSASPFIYDALSGWLTLQNLRVRGNLIVEGTVDSPQLTDGAVITPKVEDDAISSVMYYENASPGFVSGAPSSSVVHLEFDFYCQGGKVFVQYYGEIGTPSSNPAGTTVRLTCDGNDMGGGALWNPGAWGAVGVGVPFGHEPGVGWHHYAITYRTPSGGSPSAQYTANRTFAFAMEMKK
jgi:hypothetical protein